MNARIGGVLFGLGVVIALVSLYFYDAAGNVVNPEDVVWGLGHLFRDIDTSDIKLMQRIGLTGIVVGASLLLIGLVLMIRKKN